MWRDLSVGILKMSFTPRQLHVMSINKLVHSMVKVSMMTDDLSGAHGDSSDGEELDAIVSQIHSLGHA